MQAPVATQPKPVDAAAIEEVRQRILSVAPKRASNGKNEGRFVRAVRRRRAKNKVARSSRAANR